MTSAFSDAFWPGFWATLVGVGLGIPAGLAVQRLVDLFASRKQTALDQATLFELVGILTQSLEDNASTLAELVSDMEHPDATALPVGGVLVLSDWEVVRNDVGRLVKTPGLRANLGRWFERLSGLERLIALQFEFTAGTPAAMQTSYYTLDSIRTSLSRNAKELIDGVPDLVAELRKLLPQTID